LDIHIGILVLVSLIALMFAQVCARVFLNTPIQGADELSKYFFIFCVYISMANVDRTSGQIQLDLILDLLPGEIRKLARAAIYICTTLVFAIIAYSSVIMLASSLKNKTPALGIPYLYFMMPTVVGFVLITLQRVCLPIVSLIAKSRQSGGQ
jgi:TRAP-type C4-dicarboxylate transport system permease small subunit